MKTIIKIVFIVIIITYGTYSAKLLGVGDMENFNRVTPLLSSSGLPSEDDVNTLKAEGFQHIINLLPGDYQQQKLYAENLGISYDQIEVIWKKPILENFQSLIPLMKKYQGDKVLIHCYINYRASAFVYLYQTTQLGVDEETAKTEMLSIWEPEGTWLEYIQMVQKHYQKN